MIQEIHGIYHNEYHMQKPSDEDYIMFVQARSVLMNKDDKQPALYMTYKALQEASKGQYPADTCRYLFHIEVNGRDEKYFLGKNELLPDAVLNTYEFKQQNIFRSLKPEDKAFAGITACQLANWYENTQFCGRCGARLEHDKTERMMRCPVCDAMHYPKISPAVIVAVTNGDKLLMTKYAGRDYKKYALIAGFTEIGETVEETVHREVAEEVGVRVKNIRYYKSQPWSFSDTILMGFYCELDGEDVITMDEDELSVAEWIPREEIPTQYDGISLTNEMIMHFKENQ